jgi:hypothetical protein
VSQPRRKQQRADSPISNKTTLLLQANLQASQAMAQAMTTYLELKTKETPKKENMINDDSAKGESASHPSKFTAHKAAPFHGWAGFKPGHLFKTLPTLFSDLVEGSSAKRHGMITNFFCTLERQKTKTFAGCQPSDDSIDDVAKFKFAPPK